MTKLFKHVINGPSNIVIKFLNWLNKDSMELLLKEKEKFNHSLVSFAQKREIDVPNFDCINIFFHDCPSGSVEKKDVIRLHDKFDEKATAKSSKRLQVIQTLQWVTLALFSALITGIPSLEFPDWFKIILICVGVLIGIVITKIQKNKLITIRLDAYKYKLKQIQLEKIYVKKGFLPYDVIVNKSLRGSFEIKEEDRDIAYEKYSLTNLSLIIIFLIQIMYGGALIITLLKIFLS